MKENIIVKRNLEVLYKGRLFDLPIKEKHIVNKSIEIFGDDEPCIIHQSFVIKEILSELLVLFKENSVIKGKDYIKDLSFLNYEDIESISLELVRKK